MTPYLYLRLCEVCGHYFVSHSDLDGDCCPGPSVLVSVLLVDQEILAAALDRSLQP